MAGVDEVLNAVDAGLDASLARLSDFLRIPSISTDPAYAAACRQAADFAAEAVALALDDAGLSKEHDRLPEFFSKERVPPHNAIWDFTPEELDTFWNF